MINVRQRLERLFELPGSGARILSMEGLRGLAVSLVFLVHYESLFGHWLRGSPAGASVGNFLEIVGRDGVDLFFVLSGYLIYRAALKSQIGYGKFMRRRVRRIYPTFAAIFVVYLALSVVMPSESKIPAGRTAALVYVIENALLLPGMFDITPIITVAWSLSFEVFYYAVIPLVVAVFALRRRPPRVRVAGFLAVAAALSVACLQGVAGHVQLILFVSGILVYEATQSEAISRLARGRGGQAVSLAALALFLPVGFALETGSVPGMPASVSSHYTLLAVWLFAALFALVLVAFVGQGPVHSMFSVAPLRWLGNMSYSYYLLHALTLKGLAFAVARARPGWNPGAAVHWAFLPVAFAVTLVTSAILFALIERPLSLAVPRTRPVAAPRAPATDPAMARATKAA